jgi:hypothetical protein
MEHALLDDFTQKRYVDKHLWLNLWHMKTRGKHSAAFTQRPLKLQSARTHGRQI